MAGFFLMLRSFFAVSKWTRARRSELSLLRTSRKLRHPSARRQALVHIARHAHHYVPRRSNFWWMKKQTRRDRGCLCKAKLKHSKFCNNNALVLVDSANINTTTDCGSAVRTWRWNKKGIRANLWWKHVVIFSKTISLRKATTSWAMFKGILFLFREMKLGELWLNSIVIKIQLFRFYWKIFLELYSGVYLLAMKRFRVKHERRRISSNQPSCWCGVLVTYRRTYANSAREAQFISSARNRQCFGRKLWKFESFPGAFSKMFGSFFVKNISDVGS